MKTRHEIAAEMREINAIADDHPEQAYWQLVALSEELSRLQASEALHGGDESFGLDSRHI